MKRILLFTLLTIFLVGTFSCKSLPTIPENASSTQLIQLGQDAAESSNYTAAEMYYEAVIKRYGMNTSTYIEAKYELGHLYKNMKKYDAAFSAFQEILDIFENAEPGALPAAYKKLAKMGISSLPQKYQNNSATKL